MYKKFRKIFRKDSENSIRNSNDETYDEAILSIEDEQERLYLDDVYEENYTLSKILGRENSSEIDTIDRMNRKVDLTMATKQIRNELSKTDIETIDITPIYVGSCVDDLPGQTEPVTINSKYRVFGNRKKKQQELIALHKVFIKENKRNRNPYCITVQIAISASNTDSMSHGIQLLMQWSLYIAEAIINGDQSLCKLLPNDYVFPRANAMAIDTRQFEGTIVYASTKEDSLLGDSYRHTTTPFTTLIVDEFSENDANVESSPFTITNRNNSQYYKMTNLYNGDN